MTPATTLARKESGEISSPEATRAGLYFTPRVDIYETRDEVVLQCDMPGTKAADFDLQFERGELALHGRVAPRHTGAAFLTQEYGVGDFYRNFTIAPEIDSERIAAEYRDGVLTIHLPKQETAKPRQIKVCAG